MRKYFQFFALALLIFQCGCVGFRFQQAAVSFDDPAIKLGIRETAPTEEEKQGILLRLAIRDGQTDYYMEETRIFAKIRSGQGFKMDLLAEREDRYKATEKNSRFRRTSSIKLLNQTGEFFEDIHMGKRGEITRLLKGFHKSKAGKFTVLSWQRTPIFHDRPVKIGDEWKYYEEMNVKVKSPWVKQINPTPYVSNSKSTLEGFALVKDIRCAVIKTEALETKQEHMKILFKDALFTIEAKKLSRTYFDYKNGKVIARVDSTRSRTFNDVLNIDEYGQSQTIVHLTRNTPS